VFLREESEPTIVELARPRPAIAERRMMETFIGVKMQRFCEYRL
jgi:hypothetical protein